MFGGFANWTSAHRANRANDQARHDIRAREQGALGELTPEAMQKLIQMFQSKYMALLAPQMMGAQQKVKTNLGRSGGNQFGLGAQLQAGIPGQFGNMALGQAVGSAIPIAQQRAGIRAQTPVPYLPKKNSFADAMSMVAQAYGMKSPEQGNTGQSGMSF